MKKSSILYIMFVLACAAFTSCILDDTIWSESQYLSQFEGEFTKKGRVALPERLGGTYLRNFSYTAYYSTALEKDVLVSNMATSVLVPEYESNFLYLKYADDVTSRLENLAKKDFSDLRVVYDFDWNFTNKTDGDEGKEEILHDMRWQNAYILVRPTSEEKDELEKRLRSLSYRLYENEFRSHVYLYVTYESEFDFSSLTFDSLYGDKKTRAHFSERYVLDNYEGTCKEEE